MFDKFDHKFKGNHYYDFVILFVGTFFAMCLIMPDKWLKPFTLLIVVFVSAAVAKFAASNRNRN